MKTCRGRSKLIRRGASSFGTALTGIPLRRIWYFRSWNSPEFRTLMQLNGPLASSAMDILSFVRGARPAFSANHMLVVAGELAEGVAGIHNQPRVPQDQVPVHHTV